MAKGKKKKEQDQVVTEASVSEPVVVVTEEVEETPQEMRKAALIAGLITPIVAPQSALEESKEEAPKSRSTVNAFKSDAVVSGPFSRKRISPKGETKKVKESVNPRRGVFKIWDNKAVNNVGAGKNSYDVSKERK